MRKAILVLLALAALVWLFYPDKEAESNIPKKIGCRMDSDCTLKATDCTCGGAIYSCVNADYPTLECRNESFTCSNKKNPKPDSCACQNNLCTAASCASMCGEWKNAGYSEVLKNLARLEESGCCGSVEDCTDRCAGGPETNEEELDCIETNSPQEYARILCKGYVSNNSAREARLPVSLKKEALAYSFSCFYAGESVLSGYAFYYNNRFCDLSPAGLGFLAAPVGAEEALDYYLFSTRNLSEKKDEKKYELISDFVLFLSSKPGCNLTRSPPVNHTRLSAIAGGYNLSVLEYLPLKKQAVYEQALVYKNGNIERVSSVVLTC